MSTSKLLRSVKGHLAHALCSGVQCARLHAAHARGAASAVPADLAAILVPDIDFVADGGILVDRRWSPEGVTSQFTDDAQTYHERYFDRLDFTALIDRCLRVAKVDVAHPRRVLDIGSGSGASVLALCRLLPQAHVVASDISPPLLRLLARFAATRGELHGRITALCFDLHRRVFRPGSFDLVVGCAILHHLADPRAALANVAASLRPGGRIVLVEPLESGSLMLVAMFATVLAALVRAGEGDGRLAVFMRAMRLDIQSRLGPPVEKPWTRRLDDKWVFDEPYLLALGKELGVAAVDVYPAEPDLTGVYEKSFRSLLADGGLADVPIPAAVVDAVRAFDDGIAPELKRELCPTGVIVFSR